MKQYKTVSPGPDTDKLQITEQLVLWLGLPLIGEGWPTDKIDISQVRALVNSLLLLRPQSRHWWVGVLLYSEDAAVRQLMSWIEYCVVHKPAPCSSLSLNQMVTQWLFTPYDASSCRNSARLASRALPVGRRVFR